MLRGHADLMIREARSDDIAAIREIERAAGQPFREIGMAYVADDEPPSEEVLRRYVTGGRAWVAVDDRDRPVAYLITDILDGDAHIEQVSVHPASSRRGLGRALIEHTVDWASVRGLHAVTLTTFADVPWNGPYYRRLGFEVIPDEQVGPGLRERRAEEGARGFDRWPRICMRLRLPR
jgi:GNAT superfamily N-acetyltransferase